jgi:hypothetical protein
MSEEKDELELQALQRELDGAFASARPRRGFDDELWARLQQSRPAPTRLRAALSGLRWSMPRVPLGAVAAVVVVALLAGAAYLGAHMQPRGGGASSNTALSGGARAPQDFAEAAFGRLPSPVFAPGKSVPTAGPSSALASGVPIHYVWAGAATYSAAVAPVYRYQEPTASSADGFASQLGAVLRERPDGFLGSYSTATYTLKVRGTVQSPPSSPAFFIFASLSMPPVEATGASQADLATQFLAAHGLTPDWPYAVMFTTTGDPTRVVYQRQFVVPGYGPAYLVDPNGERYGLEVDLSGNRPVIASGMLPVGMDTANYSIVSPGQALAPVLGSPASSGSLTATLKQGELVYVLVPAGDHSFYEPAYLFTGTMQAQGSTVQVRLLMPAVDPSQRT